MVSQYEVWLVALDLTIGHEIKKTRPAVVISPDEMNEMIATVLIAPMNTKSHTYPSRVALRFAHKDAWVVLDKIRCIDKTKFGLLRLFYVTSLARRIRPGGLPALRAR